MDKLLEYMLADDKLMEITLKRSVSGVPCLEYINELGSEISRFGWHISEKMYFRHKDGTSHVEVKLTKGCLYGIINT